MSSRENESRQDRSAVSSRQGFLTGPVVSLLVTLLLIAGVEVAIMLAVTPLDGARGGLASALIDAVLLSLVVGPALWWLHGHIHGRHVAELEARRAEAEQLVSVLEATGMKPRSTSDEPRTTAAELSKAIEFDRTRFDLTLAIGNIGVWDHQLPTGIFAADSRWAQIFGVDPSALPMPVEQALERLHPDDREGAMASPAAHARERTPYFEYRFRVRQADESYRWAIARGCVVERDSDDRPLRVIGVTIDIHEQALREERARESSALLGRILEFIPYSVFWKDPQGRYLGCNQAFANNAGLTSPSQLIGLTDYDMPWSREESDAYRADDAAVLRTGEARMHIQEPITTADGSNRCLDTSKVPLRDENGLALGVLGIFADVTEQRNRERELVELRNAAESANRSKSEFLANMSHEIRTPLTAILGYAEVLREELEGRLSGGAHGEALDTIQQASEHLLTVVNDVLDLSKIEAGRVEVERLEVDLPDLIRVVESLMQPWARGKGLRLQFHCATAIPSRVLTDPTRLRQVFLNIVGNAIKFTELGGVQVTISSESHPGGVGLCFDVTDSGVGVPEESIASLFEPFSQADSSTTRRFGGTGLGLAICRRLALLLGGDVELLRTERGQGSTFRVRVSCGSVASSTLVSVLSCPPAIEGRPRSQVGTRLSGRILYAEDGPVNQRLISLLLTKAGAEVDVAENGRVALDMLEAAAESDRPYLLLITDVQMPEMDGYTLARTLREAGHRLPILALTAHAMPEDRRRCLDAGCDDYLSKPVDRAELIRRCGELLPERRDFAA